MKHVWVITALATLLVIGGAEGAVYGGAGGAEYFDQIEGKVDGDALYHGDVEGFGMVAVEAAVHGTPTVAFDCGGVSDAVAEGVNGALITAGNYTDFGQAITRVVQADMRDSASSFASQFSWDSYCAQVEQGIKRVLK